MFWYNLENINIVVVPILPPPPTGAPWRERAAAPPPWRFCSSYAASSPRPRTHTGRSRERRASRGARPATADALETLVCRPDTGLPNVPAVTLSIPAAAYRGGSWKPYAPSVFVSISAAVEGSGATIGGSVGRGESGTGGKTNDIQIEDIRRLSPLGSDIFI